MNEEKIKFSICVPVYNSERFLNDCVKSVASQTYSNWELILVDDGSTDNSLDLCNKLSLSDKRIRVFHKKNSGQLYTRQFAINQATGDYCVFLDSDDYIKNTALEILMHNITEYDCDCLIYGLEAEKSNGESEFWTEDQYTPFMLSEKREVYLKILLDKKYNSICRKVIKTELLKTISKIENAYIKHGEDLLHSLVVLKKVKSILFIPDVLYFYRWNGGSISHKNEYIDYLPFISLREQIFSFLKNEDCFNKDDWNLYKRLCIKNFSDIVIGICTCKEDHRKKISVLNDLRKENYTLYMLDEDIPYYLGYRREILILFKSESYSVLIALAYLVTTTKVILHK